MAESHIEKPLPDLLITNSPTFVIHSPLRSLDTCYILNTKTWEYVFNKEMGLETMPTSDFKY